MLPQHNHYTLRLLLLVFYVNEFSKYTSVVVKGKNLFIIQNDGIPSCKCSSIWCMKLLLSLTKPSAPDSSSIATVLFCLRTFAAKQFQKNHVNCKEVSDSKSPLSCTHS